MTTVTNAPPQTQEQYPQTQEKPPAEGCGCCNTTSAAALAIAEAFASANALALAIVRIAIATEIVIAIGVVVLAIAFAFAFASAIAIAIAIGIAIALAIAVAWALAIANAVATAGGVHRCVMTLSIPPTASHADPNKPAVVWETIYPGAVHHVKVLGSTDNGRTFEPVTIDTGLKAVNLPLTGSFIWRDIMQIALGTLVLVRAVAYDATDIELCSSQIRAIRITA
jgi:hypothetical protein